MTASRHATLTYFTYFLPHFYGMPSLDVNCRKMRVQSEKIIFMFDHNQIAIEILPWTVNRIFISACEDHQPIRRRMDRCAKLVQKLHTMMRITCTSGC